MKAYTPEAVYETIKKYEYLYKPKPRVKNDTIKQSHAQLPSQIPTFDYSYESKPQKPTTHQATQSKRTTSLRSPNKAKKQENRKKLYIFTNLSLTSCNSQKHKVIEASVPLLSKIEHHYIDVPVHKCLTCKRTFISEEMWKLYMKHGIEHAYYAQEETDYDVFRKESQLHSLGYRVGANGMDVYERQLFLMGVLNKKQMTLFEIERDITNAINIHQNNSRMYDSVSDWKDDLKFLGDYVLKQKKR